MIENLTVCSASGGISVRTPFQNLDPDSAYAKIRIAAWVVIFTATQRRWNSGPKQVRQ
jgi:hypothetical protein